MAIAGTFPEQGVRVALELRSSPSEPGSGSTGSSDARYEGEAFTPTARYVVAVTIEAATGKSSLEVLETHPREAPATAGASATAMEPGDLAFIKQLGVQLWKQARAPAEQGGGIWARRVQRWRGPK